MPRLSPGRAAPPLVALALLALLARPATAGQESEPLRFEEWLPARTLLLVEAPDLKAAHTAFEASDLGGVFRAFEPFATELRRGLEDQAGAVLGDFEHETGVPPRELLKAMSSGVALAVVDWPLEADGRSMPVLALAVDGSGGRASSIAAVLAGLKAKAPPLPPGEPATYPVEGVSVEVFAQRPSVHAAWVGERLLVTTSRPLMEEVLAAAKGLPRGEVLARDAEFLAAKAKVARGTTVVFSYFRFDRYFEIADDHIGRGRDLGAVLPEPIMAAPELRKVGLDGARSYAVAIGLDGKLVDLSLAVRAPGPRRGVLALLGADGAADVSLARKAPRDAIAFTALKLDLAATMDRILAIARGVDPDVAKEMEKGYADLNAFVGVSVREDLLAPLGADFSAVTLVAEGGGLLPESVNIVRPRDPKRLEAGLRKLAETLGMKVREIDVGGGKKALALAAPLGKLGQDPWFAPRIDFEPFEAPEARAFPPPDEGPAARAARERAEAERRAERERRAEERERKRAEQKRDALKKGIATALSAFAGAWCFDGEWLYIADRPQAIADLLDRQAAGSLADVPEFKAEAARAPKGAFLVSYDDPRGSSPILAYLLPKIVHAVEPMARLAGVPIDASLLPRAKALAPHARPGISFGVADAEGIAFSSRSSLGPIPTSPSIASTGFVLGFLSSLFFVSRAEARGRAFEAEERMRAMEEEMRRFEEGRDEGPRIPVEPRRPEPAPMPRGPPPPMPPPEPPPEPRAAEPRIELPRENDRPASRLRDAGNFEEMRKKP